MDVFRTTRDPEFKGVIFVFCSQTSDANHCLEHNKIHCAPVCCAWTGRSGIDNSHIVDSGHSTSRQQHIRVIQNICDVVCR